MLEQTVILLQIIFIDIILAADNAIIIGLIAANFAPKNRKQIILWGVAGALIFKIIFALFATYLFEYYFIKILGGLLLIWIVYDLRKDLLEIKKIKSPTKKSKEPSYIQRHIWIAYVGLGFILIVAIQLIIGGLVDLEILNINEQFKKYF